MWRLGLVSFPLYDTIALFSQQRNEKDEKCLIAGGGAAGMMAAITAARNGNQVILFEKNEKLGKKLFITGKGRCNFTNAGDSEDILTVSSPIAKFLYSAFNGFSNYDTMGFLMNWGWRLKLNAATAYSRNQTIPQMSSAHYSVR